MKIFYKVLLLAFVAIVFLQCKTETKSTPTVSAKNTVQYAKGFSIHNYDGYSIVTVQNPWPKATKTYTYILKEQDGIVSDSLQQNTIIAVPIKNIVVTSTTHIPSLEMLDVENTLIGFPTLTIDSSICIICNSRLLAQLWKYLRLKCKAIILIT